MIGLKSKSALNSCTKDIQVAINFMNVSGKQIKVI
jgi:hypothetical protein